jgi:hypothetical protein
MAAMTKTDNITPNEDLLQANVELILNILIRDGMPAKDLHWV